MEEKSSVYSKVKGIILSVIREKVALETQEPTFCSLPRQPFAVQIPRHDNFPLNAASASREWPKRKRRNYAYDDDHFGELIIAALPGPSCLLRLQALLFCLWLNGRSHDGDGGRVGRGGKLSCMFGGHLVYSHYCIGGLLWSIMP